MVCCRYEEQGAHTEERPKRVVGRRSQPLRREPEPVVEEPEEEDTGGMSLAEALSKLQNTRYNI